MQLLLKVQKQEDTLVTLTLVALIPQIVDAVDIPVIAAGGIARRSWIGCCLYTWSSCVQMGTIFLASNECPLLTLMLSRPCAAMIRNCYWTYRRSSCSLYLRNEMTDHYIELEQKVQTVKSLRKLLSVKAVYEGDITVQ